MLTLLLLLCGVGLCWLAGLELAMLGRICARRLHAHRHRLRPLRVIQRSDFTPDLFELVLEHPQKRTLPPYQPGQFLTLAGPMLASGVPAERRYSLASWQTTPRRYILCIKREAEGRISNWLHTHAEVGATLQVRPPHGEFVLNASHLHVPTLILVAAGVGITPLKAMLDWLHDQDYRGRVSLFQAARTRADLLYADHFRNLAMIWPAFDYQPFLSAEAPPSGAQAGRIQADRLRQHGGNTAHYFFCTSHAMTDMLVANLTALGVPPAHLHFELFAVGTSGCGAFPVSIGNQTLNAEGFPSLLHVLEAMQQPIDADCRTGTCGRCRIQVESGSIRHIIPPQLNLPEGQHLACCCAPESALRLVLPGHS
jgi:ferredoxin-NADP reductase